MYRCPICGGEAVDEPGNDAFVCLSCGKLFDRQEVIDEDHEQKEMEKNLSKEILKEEDALSKKLKQITLITVLIIVFLCLAVTAFCLVKAYLISDNPYEGYKSQYGDPNNPNTLLEEIDHEYPAEKTAITEDVLREDYKQYYGSKGRSDRDALLIIAMVSDLMIIVAGATVLSILRNRIRGRTLTEKEVDNRLYFTIVACFLLIAVVVYSTYFYKKDITPDKADFRLYKIEYTGKETKSFPNSSDDRSDTCYIRFMKNGEEVFKQVTEEEFNLFPKLKGTYYVGAASDGTRHINFRIYSDKEYKPDVTTLDYE